MNSRATRALTLSRLIGQLCGTPPKSISDIHPLQSFQCATYRYWYYYLVYRLVEQLPCTDPLLSEALVYGLAVTLGKLPNYFFVKDKSIGNTQ